MTLTPRRRRLALIFAAAGIAALPLAWRGTSCGHDFDFHLESWMEVLWHWREGVVYPHWAASANYGAGEPRFVFYPPLSWMLGALLSLVMPWIRVPLVFTMVALAAMGATFYRMAREWMPENNAAVTACLYVVNPYVLFVAYQRAAYGELLAAAWMPLLVLFALRSKQSMLGLAVVIAGLWLTNAPAAVMGCYALVVIVAVAVIVERRRALIGRAAGGTALGLGLAGFYLVPAIYEQRWVEIQRAIGEGMRVEDSFLFGHTGEAFHDQVLRAASWIAVLVLAATAIAAIISFRARKQRLWLPLVTLAVIIACLLLPFSDAAWQDAPEMRFLQFPWRWLLLLSLVLAALVGLALREGAGTRGTNLLRVGTVVVVAGCVSGMAWMYFWQPCDEEDNVRAQMATFRDGGFQGTDEYTAAPADNDAIQQDLPRIRVVETADGDEVNGAAAQNPEWQAGSADLQPSEIQIRRWDSERMSATVRSGSGFAVLRVMDYPAWRVTVNGARVGARPRRDDGLMVVPVAAGVSEIEVRYGATPDMWAGRILSLMAAILWIGLAGLAARGRRQRLS
jgi:6-pyruvoyl-tetrahydropterin synthase related domain